jgi:DNA mismatch repair protein MSH4
MGEDVNIVPMEKRCFNSSNGMDDICRLAFESDQQYLKTSLVSQVFVLSAFAAAVEYMQSGKISMNKRRFEKLRIKFEPSECTMFIDSSTMKNLQLISNLVDTDGLTFFSFMNHTMTKMGERMLRNNLLQPLSDASSIVERLQAVQELKSNEGLLELIRTELRNCQDIDKLFSFMLLSKNQDLNSANDQRVNRIILVKQAVETALKIGEQLEGTTCSLLNQIRDICCDKDLVKVKELIDEFINEDCSWASGSLDLKNQKCYAVKAGKNGFLDIFRQLYKSVIDEVISITNTLSNQHELELEQSYNSKRGFFIKILNCDNLSNLSKEFIKRTEKKKKYIECTTLDILKCNSRLDDAVNEILTISGQIIESILDEITSYLPLLFMVAEALSLLDLIQSFSHISLENHYCCPEFSSNIELKSSRHPIVETLILNHYVPNDIVSIEDLSRFQVLTGTNMSGKSVYLKQVGLITIMAQMGCFVPAECATLKLFNSLKARLSTDMGNPVKGSSFATEMKEMVCILEEIDDKSLVIIDELGGGSSVSDGFAICLSICEELIESKATVFISTHFQRLSTILSTKFGVSQNHMRTQITNNGGAADIKMEYKLTHGASDSRRYGISISEKLLDKSITKRAKEISNCLEYPEHVRSLGEVELLKTKRFHNLVAVLKYVSRSGKATQELLLKIQSEFIQ